jgi:hypothetical protein
MILDAVGSTLGLHFQAACLLLCHSIISSSNHALRLGPRGQDFGKSPCFSHCCNVDRAIGMRSSIWRSESILRSLRSSAGALMLLRAPHRYNLVTLTHATNSLPSGASFCPGRIPSRFSDFSRQGEEVAHLRRRAITAAHRMFDRSSPIAILWTRH